jgi:hypothetical protein
MNLRYIKFIVQKSTLDVPKYKLYIIQQQQQQNTYTHIHINKIMQLIRNNNDLIVLSNIVIWEVKAACVMLTTSLEECAVGL